MYDERQDDQKHQIKQFSFSCHKTPPAELEAFLHLGNGSAFNLSKARAIDCIITRPMVCRSARKLFDNRRWMALKNHWDFPDMVKQWAKLRNASNSRQQEQSMDSEAVDRLMDILLQMKINFGHITETLHQQTFEIRQQLAIVFEHEKKSLEECLAAIDRKLGECAACVESYRAMYAHLGSLRERLVQLGGHPTAMPAPLPAKQLHAIVEWRLEELRLGGKL